MKQLSSTQPHDIKKRLLYNIVNICWEQDLEISTKKARAARKICEAILETVGQEAQQPGPKRQMHFEKIKVPADGMCGWYPLVI